MRSKGKQTLSFVSISRPVKDRIVQAARETPTEIIGLLLGRLQEDTVIIEDSTTHEFSSEPHRVTLPPNSIAVIADRLVSGRLKGNIVGWYHSHTEGGLFFSETDIATQKQLQQFSSLITGIVVDSSNGELGCFRVIPGTNEAVRLDESNISVFVNSSEAVPERHPVPTPAPAPTPTVEVRRRRPRGTAMPKRATLALILVALIVSIAIFAAVLYRYSASPNPPVTLLHMPVSTATVGTPVEILTNVTGPGRNVTLVYGLANGGPLTQAPMGSVATGEYGYSIPANLVTGNLTYYIKAYDAMGRQINTTLYFIPVADFGLQPQTNALTIYRTKTASLQLQLTSINNFNRQVQLSTSGNTNGLNFSFSGNPVTTGMVVDLNIAADGNIPNGTYPVTLVGTYSPPQSPEITRQSVIDITVADFQATVTPQSATVQPGTTAAFTVTLTLQKGFVNPVNMTDVAGLPQGATYTIAARNPNIMAGTPGTTEITLQIRTLTSTKAGTYPIVIVISGGGVIHTLSTQIIVR